MKGHNWNITELGNLKTAVKEILALSAAGSAASGGARVLALHGELGAGKTTFVQELGKLLGVEEAITSPTFVIMKRYAAKDGGFKTLVHIDAYRIENIDEMRVVGFEALLKESNTIICIEWAEKIAELLPLGSIHLYFEFDEGSRTLKCKI